MGRRVPYRQQLIEQARHLAAKDPNRPIQASLRRAVSASYYALFHCLVDDVTTAMLTQQKTAQPLRQIMARTFGHTEMVDASKSFVRAASRGVDQLHSSLRRCIPNQSVHRGVTAMCEAFVALQEARHLADYDLSTQFKRHECLAFVQEAENAISAWDLARKDPSAQAYMLSLLLWKKMRRD